MNRGHVVALVILAGLYHAAALARDAEAVEFNLARFRQDRSPANLLRLLLAERAMVGELGWLLG